MPCIQDFRYDAAPEAFLPVVKHRALSRGDSPLGRVKGQQQLPFAVQDGRARLVGKAWHSGRSRAEHGSLKPAVRTLFSRQPVKDYPHLFLVLDDFVALELSEEAITLLEWILQKARLVKVHVILVTSLPSSRSLSSGILSNTDYRIAFRVTSKADSIRAIGRAGANELATPGEMIVRTGVISSGVRRHTWPTTT